MSVNKRPAYRSVDLSEQNKKSVDVADDFSYNSHMPLTTAHHGHSTTSIPPLPGASIRNPSQTQVDGEGLPPQAFETQPLAHGKPTHSARNSSWDLLGGARKIGQAYEQFDPRNASEQHLAFADGDLPNSKFVRFYQFLLNASIVTRWTLFIVPILIIIWIPGVIGVTASPRGKIWGVRLIWWSIWLSVAWCGWWASLALAMIFPRVVRNTVGVVAVGARRYIDWFTALYRYVALFVWSLTIWIAWNPLIDTRQDPMASARSVRTIEFITRLLFGIYLCTGLLLFEKFSIQWIAAKFHERSYAERIADQKFAVKTLTTLYRHSTELHLHESRGHSQAEKHNMVDPRRFMKQALKGVRFAATTTTTALGNVASEIAGSSVLQPNSPQAMVLTALESGSKTKLLARRIFFSFCKSGKEHIFFQDISRYFSSQEEADAAFSLFDRDGNGDVSLEETEQACAEFHREQQSIEHSMRDLDSAVGRLDNLFMSLYVVVAILIIAVTLEAQLASFITATGTLVLGLSWLIGSSLHDILTSIIFLFVRHPFDVGDRIDLGAQGTFTVKEIRLLSTIFLDGHGTYVQVSNNTLAGLFIQNIRRSPKMSESFVFDVDYSTTFEQIENLRSLMLGFVQMERRDFQPSFDISVMDIPDQEKMVLQADIMYKSNWQQGTLKATRRNKWICALKTYLAEAKIYGPKGNPAAIPAPTRYTVVPWDEVQEKEEKSADRTLAASPVTMPEMPSGGYNLMSRSAIKLDDTENVFEESGTVTQPPRRPVEQPLGASTPAPGSQRAMHPEEIEMFKRE
ncbi:Mechanosensitive ion channel-domain-containing protein [Russula earlei]|uniref:Mechanosensitive ion channel-domain-containing protein n=1 Tax=Russula earlei TaxID=71964 RepID=A0ACC0UHK9_9AGAM|nr:Mechanosensitive ion channel-domain-containing protein [Russula earlei]